MPEDEYGHQIIVIPNNLMAPPGAAPLGKRVQEMRKYNAFMPRFIVALSISKTEAEACRRIRVLPQWFANKPEELKQMARELAEELRSDPILQANEMIGNGVVEAAAKKMQLVNSKDERIADRASTYVLDKVLGKAATSNKSHIELEITGMPWQMPNDKKD
jgi:hypothetical protein